MLFTASQTHLRVLRSFVNKKIAPPLKKLAMVKGGKQRCPTMIYALAVLVFVFALTVFGPPVWKADRAYNNWLGVGIYDTPVTSNGNDRSAVLVQERGEWRLCKVVGIACAGAFLGVWHGQGWQVSPSATFNYLPLVTLLVQAITDTVCRLSGWVDYAGHGAEIIEAERLGVQDYREAEIQRMIVFDDRDNMTHEEVDAKLRQWHWLARIVHVLGRNRLT